MITVKLFGLLRLNSGIREKQLEAATVKEALAVLTREGISPKELDGCVIFVNGKNASSAAASSYISGQSAKNIMLWAESHDTFEGESGINIKNTSGLSDDVIAKTWAMVASRKDASALYFARPGDARMGEASTDATYKSTAVAEVNKFHNLFVRELVLQFLVLLLRGLKGLQV
jgi:molybdopterin converting factor small subunit